jgi:hypothetical protein
MASYMTSSTLIDSVKRRESIPTSQVTFETEDFLAFANEEISVGLLPSILQFHEEYLVYSSSIPLVANRNDYSIPSRAVGNKIRAVFYQDSTGNLTEVSRVFPEDRAQYDVSDELHFFLQNNSIVLVPGVGSSVSGSLLVMYYLRPNQLVEESRIAAITAIDRTTGVLTVDAVPSVISASTPVDLIEKNGGHKTLQLDVTPIVVNSTTNEITLNLADIPDDLAVGDHVALAGECMIPQIPDDLHVVLAQRVAARCLEALGDQNGLNAANTKLAELEQRMGNVIDNRTEGNPQKAVNKNSFLRWPGRWRF